MANVRILSGDGGSNRPGQAAPLAMRLKTGAQWREIRIPRADGTAHHFQGRTLASALGWSPRGTLWYELHIHMNRDGQFIGEIRLFFKSSAYEDRAMLHGPATLPEIIAWLEQHDTAEDILPPDGLNDDSLAESERVLRALGLKQRLQEARNRYRECLGELLYDIAGTP